MTAPVVEFVGMEPLGILLESQTREPVRMDTVLFLHKGMNLGVAGTGGL